MGEHEDSPKCEIDTLKEEPDAAIKELCANCDWDADFDYLAYDKIKKVYSYNNCNGNSGNFECTPFKRGIRTTFLDHLNGDDESELLIKIIVSWESSGFGYQEIVLRDTLLKW